MNPNPNHDPPSDWPIAHPWLYVYTVITALLGGLLAYAYLLDFLKGALP